MPGKIVTVISTSMFILLGVAYLFFPVEMGALTDFSLTTATAKTELASFYGGLELALGTFLILCLIKKDLFKAGLILQCLAFSFLATTRLFGMIRYSEASYLMIACLVVEVLVSVISFRSLNVR